MHEQDSNNSYFVALGSFCLGALAGSLFGLLYAPRPGPETRERMSEQLRKTAESAGELKGRLLRKGERALYEASRRTREAADAISSRLKRTAAEAAGLEG